MEKLRDSLVELIHITSIKRDFHILLIHTHSKRVSDVLNQQILTNRSELLRNIDVLSPLVLEFSEEHAQGFFEDVFWPHCGGVWLAGESQILLFELRTSPLHFSFLRDPTEIQRFELHLLGLLDELLHFLLAFELLCGQFFDSELLVETLLPGFELLDF